MYHFIAQNAGACMLAAAGIITGIILILDRLTQKRWEPLIIDRGEIVDGLNADNPLNVLAPRDKQ